MAVDFDGVPVDDDVPFDKRQMNVQGLRITAER